MARCPACASEVRERAAILCPYCGVTLETTRTRTAAIGSAADAQDRPVLEQAPRREAGAVDGARFAPGRLFASRFRIVSLLGRGAMGEVYRAEDLRLGQSVALKLMSPWASHSDEASNRFASEVRLARGIVHPNVCRVFDIGEVEGWEYLSMEYVDGETLASVRQRIGRLPFEKSLDVARQLCAGLAAAHAHGVLHRDLKPSNIMLDGRGRVRIMDFGIATRVGDRVHEIAGTPAYIAPEQLAGAAATERSDLFALGLVLYEICTGTTVFDVRTFEERLRTRFDPLTLGLRDGMDPRMAPAVRACLAADPADRPASAAEVAAGFPGGDAISAALAEGRVLPPDIVAAAGASRPMSRGHAWLLLAAVFAGALLVAAGNGRLTVTPEDIPKPPEVLAERAVQLLATIGHGATAADRASWFDAGARSGRTRALRFVYRTSPQHLIPQNLFHFVTISDPPMDVRGMATVVLDLSGRLVSLSRVAPLSEPASPPAPWPLLFSAAGLTVDDFEQSSGGRPPVLPHDLRVTWTPRRPGLPALVTAATFGSVPVYFNVDDTGGSDMPRRGVLSTRRSAGGEAALWLAVIVIFTTTVVMVRRNLRAGEGDLRGALILALVVVGGGFASTMLRAHHVPDPVEELVLVISIIGWMLVWGVFSWLSYVAFEPHVRRLWPRTLVSWTRLLAGRVRDPLVGRDVLIGALGGVALAGAAVLQVIGDGHAPSDPLVALSLDALLTPGRLTSYVIFAAVDALQYALGAVFLLLFLRLVLRRTWPAIGILIAFSLLLAEGAGLPYAIGGAALFFVVVLRVGLLSGATMLITQRLLTRIPITLDLGAWYAGTTTVVMLLVVGLALWGFSAATVRRTRAW